MRKQTLTYAGLVFCALGMFSGIALSSAVPASPVVYGVTAAMHAAVVAAVIGAIRRYEGGRSERVLKRWP